MDTERLELAGNAWRVALAERDAAIVDAFERRIPGAMIASAVGLSVAAVYRIKDAAQGHQPPSRRPGVTITMTYPTPPSEADLAATRFVLVATDPYWIRLGGAVKETPGKAVVTIEAEGWPVVAAAIRTARETSGPGWLVSVSSSTLSPDALALHSTS